MGFTLDDRDIFVAGYESLKRDFVDKARAVPGVQGCSLKKSDRR